MRLAADIVAASLWPAPPLAQAVAPPSQAPEQPLALVVSREEARAPAPGPGEESPEEVITLAGGLIAGGDYSGGGHEHLGRAVRFRLPAEEDQASASPGPQQPNVPALDLAAAAAGATAAAGAAAAAGADGAADAPTDEEEDPQEARNRHLRGIRRAHPGKRDFGKGTCTELLNNWKLPTERSRPGPSLGRG